MYFFTQTIKIALCIELGFIVLSASAQPALNAKSPPKNQDFQYALKRDWNAFLGSSAGTLTITNAGNIRFMHAFFTVMPLAPRFLVLHLLLIMARDLHLVTGKR